MPSGDRTGPMGQGSMSGRGFGFCSGNERPGYASGRGGGFGSNRGMGRGRGMGRQLFCRWQAPGFSWWRGWSFPAGKDEEVRLLKSQSEALKRSQADIERRLAELEKPE